MLFYSFAKLDEGVQLDQTVWQHYLNFCSYFQTVYFHFYITQRKTLRMRVNPCVANSTLLINVN